MMKWLRLVSLLAIVGIVLSACGAGAPQTGKDTGCPTLITATFAGREIYRHEGTAWWFSERYPGLQKREGFAEDIGLDTTIKQMFYDKSAVLTEAMGMPGIKIDFFGIDHNEYSQHNQIVWTDDGVEECKPFSVNYDLVPSFQTVSHLNQNGIGPKLTTQDYGSYVSFVAESNLAGENQKGATLQFSVKKDRLVAMMIDAFTAGEVKALTADIAERHYVSDEEYGKALTDAILNTYNSEAIYLNFPNEDLAGRQYMLQMLPKVLGMMAVDYPDHIAVLKGRLTMDIEASTEISMVSYGIRTKKFFLGSTTSGGGSSMNFSQTATMSDVYEANIYFVK